MLILSRKLGEDIIIGHNIRVTLVQIRSDSVRLGIDAPKDIPVHRREVEERNMATEGRPFGDGL